MPIDLDDLGAFLSEAETGFRHGGQEPEDSLAVSAPELVQLRKACRSLAGGEVLLTEGYYTLAIEAAFTSIEKSLLFWLIDEGHLDPARPPQSHTTSIDRARDAGLIDPAVCRRLDELCRENRAKTYYPDGIASRERATTLSRLATRLHEDVQRRTRRSHECVCP